MILRDSLGYIVNLSPKKTSHTTVLATFTLCDSLSARNSLRTKDLLWCLLSGVISPPWQGMHDAKGRTTSVAGKGGRRVRQRILTRLMIKKKSTKLGWK